MSEPWNVKQEVVNVGRQDYFTKPTQIYMPDSLDILREKLIQDFKEYEYYTKNIDNIINKRFGVE